MGRLLLMTMLFGWAMLSGPVRACDCDQPATPKAGLERARAVFRGEVTGIQGTREGSLLVTFRVERWWKGGGGPAVAVITERGGGACGYAFELRGRYLVYAEEDGGETPRVSICNRTRTVGEAERSGDLAALGAGTAPRDAESGAAAFPEGRWSVEFANGVVQACEFAGDGTTRVTEPGRTAAGRASVEGAGVVVRYEDDRVERWTRVGTRAVVEHWYPAARYPAEAPVAGIARPAPDAARSIPVTVTAEAYSLPTVRRRITLVVKIHNGTDRELRHSTYGLTPRVSGNGETFRLTLVELYRGEERASLPAEPPAIAPPDGAGVTSHVIGPGQDLAILTDLTKWKIPGGWQPGPYRARVRVERLAADGGRCELSVLSEPFAFEVN